MVYAWMNGYAAGASLHSHYLELKGIKSIDEQVCLL